MLSDSRVIPYSLVKHDVILYLFNTFLRGTYPILQVYIMKPMTIKALVTHIKRSKYFSFQAI